MPDGPDELPLTFRPLLTRVVLLTVGGATVISFTIVAFAMPAPWTVTDRVLMTVAGVVILTVLAVLSRPKVVATRDGLVVVNPIGSHRLEWAQVLRVNLRPGDPWARLDLADGTTLPAMGIQPGGGRRRATRDARRLRSLAERYGTGHPAGG